MRSGMKGLLRASSIGAVLLVVAGLAAWRLGSASGAQPTLSIGGVPASVSAGGTNFNVQISVAGVTDLTSYEWQLTFDPNVVALNGSPTNGPFLVLGMGLCVGPFQWPSLNLEPGNVRYGCASSTAPGVHSGVTGEGLLSTVTFSVVGDGAPAIGLACAGLGGLGGDNIPIGNVSECVFTGATPTVGPGDTPTPVGPDNTPGGPTATPVPTAAGPIATPTPLPPGFEAVDLAAGCNPVATTYADATPIGTIAAAVGPAGNLEALWELQGSAWLGYSPAYPQASDLAVTNLLDVVFLCVNAPGAFVRPLV